MPTRVKAMNKPYKFSGLVKLFKKKLTNSILFTILKRVLIL